MQLRHSHQALNFYIAYKSKVNFQTLIIYNIWFVLLSYGSEWPMKKNKEIEGQSKEWEQSKMNRWVGYWVILEINGVSTENS